jgi:hypothetical protein
MSANNTCLEIEMNQILGKMQMAEPAFQRRNLMRLKSEIISGMDSFKMSEERKSYLLHQLANVHDMDSTMDLIREVDVLQLAEI